MAILLLDGFDSYTTSSQKWPLGTTGHPFVGGRLGGNAMNVGTINNLSRRNLTGSYYSTLVGGVAFNQSAASQGYPVRPVLGFMRDGVEQLWVGYSAGFRFNVYRQSTLLAEETTVRGLAVWNYVELKVTFATGATGSYELRVNEQVVLSATNVQTAVSTANANEVALGCGVQGSYNGGNSYRDDLYVTDSDYLGDIRVETLYPNANGNSSVLVGSDANSTDNYLLVDETVPDDDTTFVESSTVGDKDTYGYGNLATTSGAVHGVQINARARKTDAGARSIATVARHSGSEVDSADRVLSTSYVYLAQDVRETKPGGGAWSISDVNGAEFGVKVTA